MSYGQGSVIYVVTPPDLPRTQRLADELMALGWEVEIADTPQKSSRIDGEACVVMLTRMGSRDPAILEAFRHRPRVMLPMLAEPMAVPAGPWTSEPIEMRFSIQEVAAMVINAIDMPTGRAPATRRPSRPRPDDGMPPISPASRTPSRPQSPGPYIDRTPSRPRIPIDDRLPPMPRYEDDRPSGRGPRYEDRPGVDDRLPREMDDPYTSSRPRDPYSQSRPRDPYAQSRPRDPYSQSRPRDPYAASRPGSNFDDEMPNPAESGRSRDSLSFAYSRKSAVVGAVPPVRKRTSPLSRFLSVVLILLLLGGGGFGAYYVHKHPSILQKFGFGGASSTATTYAAAIPGSGCDKGNAKWGQSVDQNFTFACQQDGLLITQKANFNTFSGMFFEGTTTTSIASNYTAQVSATLQSTEPTNTVGMLIHISDVGQQQLTSGYLFVVTALGEWELVRVGTPNNTQLAIGYLSQTAKTYTLAITASGPIMTLAINGTTVGAFTDTTYTATKAVGLVISNPGGTQPVAAAFAQFSFQNQGASTVTAESAAATATAQATQALQTPYTATVPGPGCDKGAAQWAPPAALTLPGAVTCSATAMTLTKDASAGAGSIVGYFGYYGALPANYSVGVTVDPSKLNGGCAAIYTRFSTKGAYLFALCDDGSWDIDIISNGTKTALRRGSVPVATSYDLLVTDNGGAKSFTINNRTATATSTVLTDTTFVGLGIITAPGGAGVVSYSNFKLTPLAANG